VTGERLGQADWPRPSEFEAQALDNEAGFTGSSGSGRALPETRMKGTGGEE